MNEEEFVRYWDKRLRWRRIEHRADWLFAVSCSIFALWASVALILQFNWILLAVAALNVITAVFSVRDLRRRRLYHPKGAKS